jgi:hypothetical protein
MNNWITGRVRQRDLMPFCCAALRPRLALFDVHLRGSSRQLMGDEPTCSRVGDSVNFDPKQSLTPCLLRAPRAALRLKPRLEAAILRITA